MCCEAQNFLKAVKLTVVHHSEGTQIRISQGTDTGTEAGELVQVQVPPACPEGHGQR